MARFERRFIDEMVAHALEDLPNECCGIVVGKEGHVLEVCRMTNVEASPFRFSMDPREVAKVDQEAGEKSWELMAIYHSHTRSEAFPSDTDIRIAAGTSELWPEVRYLLVSLMVRNNPQVRLFRIESGVVKEEALEIIPSETI